MLYLKRDLEDYIEPEIDFSWDTENIGHISAEKIIDMLERLG